MTGQFKLVCLLFISAVLVTANPSSTPPRPVIAPQFQSDITLDVVFGHATITIESGVLYSDSTNELATLYVIVALLH